MPHTVLETEKWHSLRQRFERRWQAEPRLFRAPGRVNLIGEHTDYNGGFVMPVAISFSCWAAVTPVPGSAIDVVSLNWNEEFRFDLNETDAAPRHAWTDYIQGVALRLKAAGFRLPGARILIDSDVPIGAGLSSSAALEVSVAHALLGCAGAVADPMDIALLCQRAENDFAGMRCGIMDQFASCFGRRGHALLLDCRALSHQPVPLPEGMALVVCNSMVKHELAASAYNRRREECERGARLLGAESLRDITTDFFDREQHRLDDTVRRRCRHVIYENIRTLDAADALRQNDWMRLGELMHQSHQSLCDDFNVSCEELNLLVELAENEEGVYGARMTGGGFGGCTVNLVSEERVDAFTESIARRYRCQTGIEPQIYVCHAVDGAGEVRVG